MKFLIQSRLSQHRYKTPEGYLVCVDSILSRTGKQAYTRDEVFHDSSNEEVELDRPEQEVFSEKAMASFENKPLTIEHPDEDVNPDNINKYGVGFVRDIKRGKDKGQDVMLGTLVITDAEAIDLVESGKLTDLSCGYDCDIDEKGLCQRNIRGNHVALCEQGRAGIARIVDSMKDNRQDEIHYLESAIHEMEGYVDNWSFMTPQKRRDIGQQPQQIQKKIDKYRERLRELKAMKDTMKDKKYDMSDLRLLCIKNKWYDEGDIDDYDTLLRNAARGTWSEDDIVTDIAVHTTNGYKRLKEIKTKLREKFEDSVRDSHVYTAIIARGILNKDERPVAITANSEREAYEKAKKECREGEHLVEIKDSYKDAEDYYKASYEDNGQHQAMLIKANSVKEATDKFNKKLPNAKLHSMMHVYEDEVNEYKHRGMYVLDVDPYEESTEELEKIEDVEFKNLPEAAKALKEELGLYKRQLGSHQRKNTSTGEITHRQSGPQVEELNECINEAIQNITDGLRDVSAWARLASHLDTWSGSPEFERLAKRAANAIRKFKKYLNVNDSKETIMKTYTITKDSKTYKVKADNLDRAIKLVDSIKVRDNYHFGLHEGDLITNDDRLNKDGIWRIEEFQDEGFNTFVVVKYLRQNDGSVDAYYKNKIYSMRLDGSTKKVK